MPGKSRPEFEALHQHVKRCQRFGVVGSSPAAFVPPRTHRQYLTKERISILLQETALPTTLCEPIFTNYLLVFTILVLIDRAIYIPQFVREPHCADSHLPFRTSDQWPPGCAEFFALFKRAQWQFCALSIKRHCLSDIKLDDETILPIIQKMPLTEKHGRGTYRIEIHSECNQLFDDRQTTDIFVLKTCQARDAPFHSNEVQAYTLLMAEKGISDNLVQYYGSWRQGDTHCILLEFADQGTLEDYFKKVLPPVSEEDIGLFWRSFLGVIRPLERMHGIKSRNKHLQGIHQDLQPSNILVSSRGGTSDYDVDFKLADFGLTSFETSGSSEIAVEHKDGRGAYMYSAPECYRPDEFTHLSRWNVNSGIDVWSLGCIFTEVSVWTVFGVEKLKEYRKMRAKETDSIPHLRDGGYSGCFHNGEKVLDSVSEMLRKTRDHRRRTDRIVHDIVGLAEDMLDEASSRQHVGMKIVYKKCHRWLANTGTQVDSQSGAGEYPPIFRTGSEEHLQNQDTVGLKVKAQSRSTPITEGMLQPTLRDHDGNQICSIRDISLDSRGSSAPPARSNCDSISHSNMSPSSSLRNVPFVTVSDVLSWAKRKKRAGRFSSRRSPSPLPGLEYAGRLYGRDQIFIVDDSKSMGPHWNEVIDVFEALGCLVKDADPDGIDLYFTNAPTERHSKDLQKLTKTIRSTHPGGECNIKACLRNILEKYHPEPDRRSRRWSFSAMMFARSKEKKGVNIYVLTDGVWQPAPRPICGLEEPIKAIVDKLVANGYDPDRVGIQFIRFGNNHTGIQRLRVLDSGLQKYGVQKDIVDTEPSTGNVWKMLFGSTDPYYDYDSDCDEDHDVVKL